MNVGAVARAVWHDQMRGYYLAIAAGLVLATSAFLPWILIADRTVGGVPDAAGLWILGLGLLAASLASLSLITRRNSRHPLLLLGLVAFGILFIAEQMLARAATEQAWATSQAAAIVAGVAAPPPIEASIGIGMYLGLIASAVLVSFGLTIVIRRVANPYPVLEDDDV